MRRLPLMAAVLVLAGCSPAHDSANTLTLATTTSTRDSGLLEVLVPMFEQQTGITVKVVAVGSGQALELGRRADADVLLVHAPDAEEQFLAEGHGQQRQAVMHNQFLLVGPRSAPAQIEGQTSIVQAFRHIARNPSPFISRGDESGTHLLEKKLWKEAQIAPQGPWYVQAGGGMAEVLRMASEKRAYTLTDQATFLAQRERLHLTVASQGDPLLRNPYSVILVCPRKHPGVNHQAASRFAEFLLRPEVQQAIGQFGVERFGEPLFFPQALNGKPQ